MAHHLRPRGQAVKTSPFHGGDMGSIPVGVTNTLYATLAQMVEQLTCGIDRKKFLFWTILHLYLETNKVDTANSGKTKYFKYMLIPS